MGVLKNGGDMSMLFSLSLSWSLTKKKTYRTVDVQYGGVVMKVWDFFFTDGK